MNKPIIYWIPAVLVTVILVSTILLWGRGGSEIPRVANTETNSLDVVQKNAQPAVPNATATASPSEKDADSAGAVKWDVVVLGRIDACYVCQRGSPRVDYTRVLAGKIPSGEPKGILRIAEIAQDILPEGGVPIYQSQQDEIIFLKKSTLDEKNKNNNLYDVLEVKQATAENLAAFRDK